MAGEWIECKLADACSAIDYGLSAPASDSGVGPRFLRITDIVSGHIDWKTVPHVAADEDTIAKYRLHDGDIVLARTGASTGTSSYVKNSPLAVFASYLVRLRAKPEFDPRFLEVYRDIPGFCKAATLEEIRKHGHVLTPGRYVGTEAPADDGEPFEEKMQRLTATLREQMEGGRKLDAVIEANLKELGYGG